MKIIDRYLLRRLLAPLVFCLLAFSMVYVIVELFNHLADFVAGRTPLTEVLWFYLLIVPSVLVFIFPVSLLLAVLYSLSALTRHNELTAMRACGVSLYRLMVPFIGVGIVSSLGVGLIHETVSPWAAFWTSRFAEAQKRQDEDFAFVTHDLAYRNLAEHRTWLIRRFDSRTFELEGIEIIQHYPDGMDAYRITADSGRRLDGRWWFKGVLVQPYDDRGNLQVATAREPRREMADLTETPQEFLNEIKDPEYLSARDLRRHMETRPLSDAARARIRVDFHHRLALPWMSLTVVFLGIPFGHHTGRRGALMGTALSLGLFFVFYVVVNLGLLIGKAGHIPPWLGAWTPILLFSGLGFGLTGRIR